MAARKTPPPNEKSAAAAPAKPPRKTAGKTARSRVSRPGARVALLANPEAMAAAGDLPGGPLEVLNDKMRLFVSEYLVDRNITRAYMRTYPGCSAPSARVEGHNLMGIPAIAGAVAAGMVALRRAADCNAEEVVSRLCKMATADERELMEVRVGCCRFCWGKDNRHQFTAGEMERAEAEHAALVERDEASGDFDPRGGTGFNANDPPSETCPECFGDGRTRAVFRDTRGLSEGAAMLFAGIKTTKDGMEVKTHSRADAMVQLGRHFGLFTDKLLTKVTVDASEELRQFLAARGGSRLPLGGQPVDR